MTLDTKPQNLLLDHWCVNEPNKASGREIVLHTYTVAGNDRQTYGIIKHKKQQLYLQKQTTAPIPQTPKFNDY